MWTGVLLAPFTTMTEMARLVVGWPSCLLNRHLYDNRMTLKSLCSKGARTWIVHGIDDEVVPISMARALAMARSAYTSTLNTTNRNRAVRPALM